MKKTVATFLEPMTRFRLKKILLLYCLSGLFGIFFTLFMFTAAYAAFYTQELCPLVSPHLKGKIMPLLVVLSDAQIAHTNPEVQRGGHYEPAECLARSRVAIVVAYRDRAEHLQMFLRNLHPVLQRQQLEYTIFVVEQSGTGVFNKGILFNAAYMEINATRRFDCFVFHDVDVYPEDDRNSYACRSQPTLLVAAMSKFDYQPLYSDYFGAAVTLLVSHFAEINGYPNLYWGWGGEDDDIGYRVKKRFGNISTVPLDTGRYTMVPHGSDQGNPKNPLRFDLVNESHLRYKTDGLNSLKYTLVATERRPLYTWLLVDVGKPTPEEERAMREALERPRWDADYMGYVFK